MVSRINKGIQPRDHIPYMYACYFVFIVGVSYFVYVNRMIDSSSMEWISSPSYIIWKRSLET